MCATPRRSGSHEKERKRKRKKKRKEEQKEGKQDLLQSAGSIRSWKRKRDRSSFESGAGVIAVSVWWLVRSCGIDSVCVLFFI